MKYIIVLFALISVTACSKKKDHKLLTVYGQVVDSSIHPIVNRDSFCVTNSTMPFVSNGVIILTAFNLDSVGNFCFKVDQSFAGQSIAIFEHDLTQLLYGIIKIPASAVDSVYVGVVPIKE